jgi:hypothetical protein
MPDRHLYEEWAQRIPPSWIVSICRALQRLNPFVHQICSLAQVIPHSPMAVLELYDSGAAEVAAIINYDNSVSSHIRPQKLRISTQANEVQQILITSRLWEPLAYPILFPHGTLGWGLSNQNENKTANVHPTQMWYYCHRLLTDS